MKIELVAAAVALGLVAAPSMVEAKGKAKTKASAKAPTGPQGTQEEARQLLEELAKPNVDHKALTAKLRPQPADFAVLFVAESATKAREAYEKAWSDPKMVIEHAPDQTDLKLFGAKVEELDKGQGEANEFPGGYKKVIKQFRPGLTIYAWRFVRPGEKIGTAYDGLVFVNGHFVWLPKPWKAL